MRHFGQIQNMDAVAQARGDPFGIFGRERDVYKRQAWR